MDSDIGEENPDKENISVKADRLMQRLEQQYLTTI